MKRLEKRGRKELKESKQKGRKRKDREDWRAENNKRGKVDDKQVRREQKWSKKKGVRRKKKGMKAGRRSESEESRNQKAE